MCREKWEYFCVLVIFIIYISLHYLKKKYIYIHNKYKDKIKRVYKKYTDLLQKYICSWKKCMFNCTCVYFCNKSSNKDSAKVKFTWNWIKDKVL